MNIDIEKNFCLHLTLDIIDENNKHFNQNRDFLSECFNCIKSWRKNGGIFKNINIYLHYISKQFLDPKIKNELEELNCIIIFEPILLNDNYGFIKVHYSSEYCFKKIKENIIIHLDLDMELLKPLTLDFFNPILKNDFKMMIGSYKKNDYEKNRNNLTNIDIKLNTDLIITTKEYHKFFYSNMIKNYKKLLVKYGDIYYLEEFAADEIYENNKNQIYIINEVYELGEGYGYIKNHIPYFWHEHSSKNLNKDLFLQKQKILKLLKNKKENK